MTRRFAIFWISLLFFLAATNFYVSAQNNTYDTVRQEVKISRVDKLVDRYNRAREIYGYRIQILSSSKKESARKAKSKFVGLYDQIAAYEIYQQPFFIVKVGDFLTKLEAEKFHRYIRDEFPESYIIPDVITPYDQYAGKSD